jgi:hypothetical protein
LSESTGIKDIDKLDNLADAILDNIKKNARIDTSDGIDKQELIEAMKDFSRPFRSGLTFTYLLYTSLSVVVSLTRHQWS